MKEVADVGQPVRGSAQGGATSEGGQPRSGSRTSVAATAEPGQPIMWMQEYRESYGLSREALGRLADCSGTLIYILEWGGITHPRIADKIASVCGAGKNERNSIVDGKHWREGWKPVPKYRKAGEKAEKAYFIRLAREKREAEEREHLLLSSQADAEPGQPTRREAAGRLAASTPAVPPRSCGQAERRPQPTEVVVINRVGQVIGRYPSCEAAAWQYAIRVNSVRNRCENKIGNTDEFKIYDVTFRYGAEWDALTEEERLKRAVEAARAKKRRIMPRLEDAYSWQGQTHSVAEWASIAGLPKHILRNRLQLGWDIERAMKEPVREYNRTATEKGANK